MTTSSARSVDVLAVGDASVDYFVRVPHIAVADDKAIGRLVGVHGGGMSANLAAAASFAGARAALATAVGSDEPGRQALERLAAHGVDVSASIAVPGGHTWFCVIQLDATGEKSLVGAVTEVKIPAVDQISDDLLRTARVVAPSPTTSAGRPAWPGGPGRRARRWPSTWSPARSPAGGIRCARSPASATSSSATRERSACSPAATRCAAPSS
ncbi:PfkB family carbohydrate kinase [Nonomuraea rubra]|uniref:PfkB family carbohydrate kinase n=1 Tax=Nonomuraea rubra TaxID=46180 RepID=UPI0036174919